MKPILKKCVAQAVSTVVLCGSYLTQSAMAEDSAWNNLTFSGFGRFVVGNLGTDKAEFKGYDDGVTFKPASLLGLQANYQFSDKLSVTAQGVLTASETRDSDLEWLYLTWTPADNLTIRAGRQRGPFFLYSDSIDVGYSYPWINLPFQIYNGYIFPTYDGIDVTWGYSTDTIDYTLQGYAGSYGGGGIYIFGGTTDYELKKMGGLIAKARYENVEFRVSRYRGYPDLKIPQLSQLQQMLQSAGLTRTADALKTKGWGDITQLGFSYDDLNYFFRAEWMQAQSEIQYMVPWALTGYYVGGGVYWGDFTFHLTYAASQMHYSNFEQEIVPGISPELDQVYYAIESIMAQRYKDNAKSWTVGARWDVADNVALKTEVTFLNGNPGENAFYDNPQPDFDRNSTLFLFAIDWVF
ncbi:hypothetical protein JYB87_10015 [Shewanella avicenniae]|uniref:Porin n=1 Tax=Shewanella avicenniae TaxID=2814294 RepID=A0ABX7QM81_9GAMM|nr:hypothetical protein [Shewanella avicenniae]QSX32122.1 hypothetical protein JYB87_10015 [Shewanella avicenniae]